MDQETIAVMRQMFEEFAKPINQRLDAMQGKIDTMQAEINEKFQRQEQFERETRTLIESKVMKEISVIAEQHGEIISQLKAVNQRRDASVALRGSVRTLEDVARNHTQRIEVLEAKAQ